MFHARTGAWWLVASLTVDIDCGCRIKDQHGSLTNVLVYAAFFLPTSVNAAWLSVASSVGLLIVPKAFGLETNLELFAVLLAAIVTILGMC